MKKFIYTLIFAAVAFACTPADPLEGVVVDNTVSAVSTIDIFSRDGGEDFITLTLKSEAREWSLHQLSGEDWCTPSVLSGKASSTIKVVVDANKEGAPREALLVFTATGCQNDTLRINQEGLIEEPVPAGMTYGINLNKEENSATLVLYELDKNEERHDYCYLLGDFNGWEPSAAYAMKRDEQRGCWWITLTDLDPAKEYMFQYYVGYVNKVGETPVRISDPFSRIIYSESDSSIEPQTYPNLPNYPSETSGLVSAFQLEEEEYDWIHTWETNPDESGKFKIEDKHDLIIYELLVRDFSETRNLQGVLDKMSYLKNLGINAIELMPVQEFDNHHSWGYDPNSYFALDKDYGTREMYKKFIDECHKNGIAVLFDVVYNHLTGASSLAKLYFQRSYTSAWNPWFNKYAPHPYSVYHDLNHDDPFLNNLVKENLKFLLEEYKIDGFRFDLTKGFTNVTCNEESASWHKEDRERFLKGYYDAIHETNKYAVMICEHFCDAEEEKLLAGHGIQLWRHSNNAYCQAAMGYSSDSDFSNMHTDGTGMPFGSLVSFMESHDEERISFKAKEYAPENVKEDLGARMRRSGICAAFSLLVPGPKMICGEALSFRLRSGVLHRGAGSGHQRHRRGRGHDRRHGGRHGRYRGHGHRKPGPEPGPEGRQRRRVCNVKETEERACRHADRPFCAEFILRGSPSTGRSHPRRIGSRHRRPSPPKKDRPSRQTDSSGPNRPRTPGRSNPRLQCPWDNTSRRPHARAGLYIPGPGER